MEKLPASLFNDEVTGLSVFNYDIEEVTNRNNVVLEQYVINSLSLHFTMTKFISTTIRNKV